MICYVSYDLNHHVSPCYFTQTSVYCLPLMNFSYFLTMPQVD